ncbi:MAG: hypothetical protein QW177_07255 [Candidatus Nitrosotenuis sp.]
MDYLRSERRKLQKKLDVLERNFEAKSQVYSEHSEDKKLLRDKKNFQIKREIILAEMSSIDENIKKIETKERMEADVRHKREWEEIKSELLEYPDKQFRSFLKQFGHACLKLKRPMLTLDEIYHEIDLADDVIQEILQLISKNDNYRGVCGIRKNFDNGLYTSFAKELSQL